MTHLLIDHDGSMKNVDLSYAGISQWTEATLRCVDDWMEFINSDKFKVFDLTDPSNTTLMYLAIEFSNCINTINDKVQIDEILVNRNMLVMGSSIKAYISFVNQIIDKVFPDSPTYAYKGEKALVAKRDAQDDLYSRIQIITEAVLYKQFNSSTLDIYVSDKFNVPYALKMYANVTQWTDEQYDEYDRIVAEETEKATAEAQN